jgi:hypothetical protein
MNNKEINVGVIGSCRIQHIARTLSLLSKETKFPLNPQMICKYVGFTHTTKETIQLLNYLDDKYKLDQEYQQLIFRPAFFLDDLKSRIKKFKNGQWRDCGFFLIEISSLKIFEVYEQSIKQNLYLNKNTLDNYFHDFLNDKLENHIHENNENNNITNLNISKYNSDLITAYYRFQIQRTTNKNAKIMMNDKNLSEFKPLFERIINNNDNEFHNVENKEDLIPLMKKSYKRFIHHLDIIKRIKYFHIKENEIKTDLITLKKQIGKPFILVSHFNHQIQQRKDINQLLKKVCSELKIPFFDPSPYVISPKDSYHYSSSDLNSIAPKLLEFCLTYQ